MMSTRSEYYSEWKANKLLVDPTYFRRVSAKHRDKRLAAAPESRAITHAKQRKKFGAKRSANAAARRCKILRRTPSWADIDSINFFYECRPSGCHVDHVIPLLGKNISGLHIAENLQWLTAHVNLSKSNSF